MSDFKHLRKKLFVDPKVQGALVLRVLFYWVTCLVTIILMLLCWNILTGPARLFYTHFNEMWFHFGPAMIASIIILPLIVVDVIRLSNRFVGPLVRLRRSMRKLAHGEQVELVHFRSDDFWREMGEEFNAIAEQLHKVKPAPSEEQEEPEPEPVGSGAK